VRGISWKATSAAPLKSRKVASRLTGISSPIFGVSWNPPAAELTVARRVIAFLEDRRVLSADESIEVPSHCVSSVIELRRYLTSAIQQLGNSDLCSSLRAMRAACRKFMESVDDRGGIVVRYGFDHGHWASWRFGAALGELRATFGLHIAKIATQNGLDVEDELAQILPASDVEDDGDPAATTLGGSEAAARSETS
jgi:hypothetical protein